MRRKSTHEQTLSGLVALLEKTGDFRALRQHVYYAANGVTGELDLEGFHKDGSVWYFEVKASRNPAAVRKAEHQACKAKRGFPKRDWRFMLVTPRNGDPGQPHAEDLDPNCHHLSGYEREYDWQGGHYGTCRVCYTDAFIRPAKP